MTLFKMWENAYINKTLPPEWPIWEKCRTWAIINRYKAEYGYKGEFSPQGCLKAMPGYKEPDAAKDKSKKTPQPKEGGSINAGKKNNARSGG